MPDDPATTSASTPTTPAPSADPAQPAASTPDQGAELAAAHQRIAALEAERDLARLGIVDEDGVAVAHLMYNRLPAEGRPENVAAWARTLTAATAPRALAPFMPGGAAAPTPAAAPPAAAAAPTAPAPAARVSTVVASGATPPAQTGAASNAGVDGDRLRQIRHEAVRTGNYEPLRAALEQFNAQGKAKA